MHREIKENLSKANMGRRQLSVRRLPKRCTCSAEAVVENSKAADAGDVCTERLSIREMCRYGMSAVEGKADLALTGANARFC